MSGHMDGRRDRQAVPVLAGGRPTFMRHLPSQVMVAKCRGV